MMPNVHFARRLCLLAAVAGCGGSDERGGTSTTTDSAGVRIVTSTATVWGDRAPRIDSVPVIRIGAEQAGPYQFSFVHQGLLMDDGQIAVVELSANEVRLFDRSGRHLRTVGRTGKGPGEFQVISGLFRYPGDSLAAFDPTERRLTIFPRAGGEPRVVRSQAEARTRGRLDVFGGLGTGQLVLYNPGSGFRPDLEPGLQWDTTEIVMLNPADGAARSIARLPSRQQFILPGGNTRVLAPAHGAIQAVAEDGFYWATSDRYEIRFFGPDGTLRRIGRRPVEPIPVVPAMVDAWIATNLEEVRQREGERAVPRYRQQYAEGSFGDRVPLFDRAFVDAGGRLWVGAAVWPERETAPRRWSIFGEDGVWLGDVEAPRRLRIIDSRDDLVLGVWQEEGGAPYVQVHRLRQ